MRVLVPLDGSGLAERALPYAAALVRAIGGRVALVHVGPEESRPEADLDQVVARLGADGVAAEAHLRQAAAGVGTADAILAAARELGPELLVMSTHGRGGLGRWLLGSVADEVLRRSELPVLLVPPTCAPSWSSDAEGCLLVALDGSALGEQVLGPATALATALGAGVVLLSVVVPPPPGYGYFEEPSSGPFGYNAAPALAAADGYLREVAAGLDGGGLVVEVRTAVGLAAPTIARLAADEGVGAIALATHGQGGLARLLLGSVAADVLQRTTVPLLVVRPAGLREGSATGERATRLAGAKPPPRPTRPGPTAGSPGAAPGQRSSDRATTGPSVVHPSHPRGPSNRAAPP